MAATQAKLTVALGGNNLKDVAVAAGTTIAGGDAMELNIDQLKMTKGDAINMLDKLRDKLVASKWPLV